MIQRLALATYKSKLPDPVQALDEAKKILSELEPDVSTDVEPNLCTRFELMEKC